MNQVVSTLAALNQQFGSHRIEFIAVTADLIKARLQFADQAQAEIHLQGAHLTQWRDTQGRDNLFTSPTAHYQPRVAIRGGNPIIFPQFGAGKMPQHGFARQSVWRVVQTQTSATATQICLELSAQDLSAAVRQYWNYEFTLRLTLTLAETLTTQLEIRNTDTQAFDFTFGFHTYFAVEAIEHAQIQGLSDLPYRDNLAQQQIFTETRKVVTIQGFTDRCYQGIPAELMLTDYSSGRKIALFTTGCDDAFVWNPGQAGEQNLADLAAGSSQRFVCIEPGCMKKAVFLQENQSFVATQQLKRID